MPAKNLYKVQKHVAKKKGKGAALHENSRDAKRLQQAARRQEKLEGKAVASDRAQQHFLERIAFFQDAALNLTDALSTTEDLQSLVQDFVSRHDEELAENAQSRRPGRPPSSREVLLKQRKALDEAEYTSGLWMPDLRDAANVEALKAWKGEWSGLARVRFVRASSDGSVKESAFPPRGGN